MSEKGEKEILLHAPSFFMKLNHQVTVLPLMDNHPGAITLMKAWDQRNRPP